MNRRVSLNSRVAVMLKPTIRSTLWFPVALGAVVVWTVAWCGMGMRSIQAELRAIVRNQLSVNLQAGISAVRQWCEAQKHAARSIGDDPVVRSVLAQHEQMRRSNHVDQAARNVAQQRLYSRLVAKCRTHGYLSAQLIDADGFILAADDERLCGLLAASDAIRVTERVLSGDTVLTPPYRIEESVKLIGSSLASGEPTMLLAAPICDGDDRPLGAIVFRIRPETEFARLPGSQGMGHTADTYAVDASGTAISNVRFEGTLRRTGVIACDPVKSSLLSVRIADPGQRLEQANGPATVEKFRETRAVTSVLRGEWGVNVNGYLDYRGEPVIGAWAWLPELGFGIISELDCSEAFQPMYALGRNYVALFAVLLLLTIGCFVMEHRLKRRSEAVAREQKANELALAASAQGMWDWNPTTDRLILSVRLRELLGGYNDDRIASNMSAWEMLIHGEDREAAMMQLDEHLATREPLKAEYRLRHASGEYRWFQVRVQAEWDDAGCPVRAVGSLIDIHDRKMAYREMIRQAEELSVSNEQLIAANREAAEANRTKDSFVANMSHELRTPLTAILGFAENLLADEEHPLAESQGEMLRTIHRNGRHLLFLINDILDLSKIEAGKMAVESLLSSPLETVRESLALLQTQADEKGVRLEFDQVSPVPAVIYTDPTRLRQILINIIGNALKFTSEGSVCVRLKHLTGDKPQLQFEVIDSGIGISPEGLSRLFQPFTQADDSMTRRFGGTGLGLAICRRLAELLGGDVSVTSELGKGSTFTFRIAANSPAETRMIGSMHEGTEAVSAPKPIAVVGDTKLPPCRVLLAEDGPDNRRLIMLILKKAGVEIEAAENGRLAVEAALDARERNMPFDLLLTDMQMPELDGYGTARRLRSLGFTLPIIALTANAMSGEREKCLEAGCDDYITKPINKLELVAMVRKHVHASVRPRSEAVATT